MATIKDVAKLANVSLGTVSNCLNNTSAVRDSTRARVLRAAAELGYKHRGTYLSLRRGEVRRTIGIIAEDLTMFNTPSIVSAIGRTAEEQGFGTILIDLRLAAEGVSLLDEFYYIDPARGAVNTLLSHDVEGIIYVGCQSREIKHIATGYQTPVAYAYCYSNEHNACSFVYDDENISCELMQHIIGHGHRTIGLIAGPEASHHVRDRLVGYQKTLFDNGILYNPRLVHFGDWESPQHGFLSAHKLWSAGATAIFCMNDILATGVIDYAHANSISVPGRLSIAGFDNNPVSQSVYPRLTTVALPLQEIGAAVAGRLIELLAAGKMPAAPQLTTLPCRIVYRSSIAAAEKAGTR